MGYTHRGAGGLSSEVGEAGAGIEHSGACSSGHVLTTDSKNLREKGGAESEGERGEGRRWNGGGREGQREREGGREKVFSRERERSHGQIGNSTHLKQESGLTSKLPSAPGGRELGAKALAMFSECMLRNPWQTFKMVTSL